MTIAEKLATIAMNLNIVHDVGRQSEYDRFWDSFQDNGNRNDYYRAFGGIGWNDNTYNPKYAIVPKSSWDCSGMFMKSRITDIYKNDTIDIDFSKCTMFTQPFSNSSVTYIKTLDTRSASTCTQILQSAMELVTVEKLILKDDGSQGFNMAFNWCNNLENIAVEGKIGQDINLQWSPKLTRESITSILEALAAVEGKTLTFSTNLDYENKMRDHVLGLADAGETTNNGITFTPDGSRGVFISGTATDDITYNLSRTPIIFPEWKYSMSIQLWDTYDVCTDYLRYTVQRASDGSIEEHPGTQYSLGNFESGDKITSIDLVIPAGTSLDCYCEPVGFIDYLYWIIENNLSINNWTIVY